MSGSADLSESAKIPQDFVTRLENETKVEEAMKTNEEQGENQSVDFVKGTKFEEGMEMDEEVNREQPVDFVAGHADGTEFEEVGPEKETKVDEVTELNAVEPENGTKFEQVTELNAVEPENGTKFEEVGPEKETKFDEVTELNAVEPENGTKFEEVTELNAVEPENGTKFEEVGPEKETKFEEVTELNAVEPENGTTFEEVTGLIAVEPENGTKFEEVTELNAVEPENGTKFEEVGPEKETKFDEVTGLNAVESENGTKFEEVTELNAVEPENGTKFEEVGPEKETKFEEVTELNAVEPENGTTFEEVTGLIAVEPENGTKFEEVTELNAVEPEKETKFDEDLETNEEKVDQKLPENCASEQTNVGQVMETNEGGEKVAENFVGGESEIEKKIENATKNETGSRKRKRKASKIKNVAKKPKLEIDLSDPSFLKPFDFGWKRELVHRSTTDGSKKNGDIYYYTPGGKKLRSRREVAEHLTDDVTIENFTFSKKPLGLNDPEMEIVRNAYSNLKVSKPSTPKIKTVTPKNKPIVTPKIIVTTTPLLQNREVRMSTQEGSRKRKIVEEQILASSTPKLPKLEVRSKKRKRTVTFAETNNKLPEPKKIKLVTENLFENVAVGYKIFLNVFKYLNVKDLLNAGRVSKMWNFMANNQTLWKAVSMKGLTLNSCKGMVNTLKRNKTVHLDLGKVSLPKNQDFWNDFAAKIKKVKSLRKIDLYRCSAEAVDELCLCNPKLEVINAIMTSNSDSMKITRLANLNNLQELSLKGAASFCLTADLTTLNDLHNLTHLSLTSINNLNQLDLSAIGNVTGLKSLGLGECVDLPASFGKNVFSKLGGLQHLRLEKGNGVTIEIFEELKNLHHLEQLELVNFDIKIGFDRALGECTQIKKLLLIPNYASESSPSVIRLVLGAVMRLQSTLTQFVWGITTLLINTTKQLVNQHNESQSEEEEKINNTGSCIPILKPVPSVENLMASASADPNEVEFISLSELQVILLKNVPNTSVKILKIPLRYTWKQSLQAWY